MFLHSLHVLWHKHFEEKLIFEPIHLQILCPLYSILKYSEVRRWRLVGKLKHGDNFCSLRVSPTREYYASICENYREIVFILNAKKEFVYHHPYDTLKEKNIYEKFAKKIETLMKA